MLVYRFRLICEEHDNFFREIDIQPGQTFLDFHSIILESTELTHCDRASFFITDKKYKKDKEISLKTEKRQVRVYDPELDEIILQILVPPLMKVSKLKNFMEDPHQKMIYEFQGKELFSFHIELFKIIQVDNAGYYPRCVRSSGELPKKVELPPLPLEVPPAPRVVVPKAPAPKRAEIPKMEVPDADETEIAEIENQLEPLLAEDETTAFEPPDISGMEDQFQMDEEEGEIEHIEDYEDLDNLEQKFSGYDRDTDDY